MTMQKFGRLATLRIMLHQMEREVGLEDLSSAQRDVYYAACLLADIGWRAHPDYRAERSLSMQQLSIAPEGAHHDTRGASAGPSPREKTQNVQRRRGPRSSRVLLPSRRPGTADRRIRLRRECVPGL